MNNLEKMGLDLYPSIKDRLLNVVLKVDMRKEYKDIFEVDCSFEEFVDIVKLYNEFLLFSIKYFIPLDSSPTILIYLSFIFISYSTLYVVSNR